jgi:hypothetical protein
VGSEGASTIRGRREAKGKAMKRKPKMVKAWAYTIDDGVVQILVFDKKAAANYSRKSWRTHIPCGPIVRIEVPAPREEKP